MDVSDLSIQIKVKNYGLEPITDPDFSFQLDEGDVFTESYAGTIMPDSVLCFTFTEKIDISAIGSYLLKTWLDYAPDQNPDNDLLETPVEVIEGSLMVANTEYTFDSWESCLSVPICELYSCPLTDGWMNLTNDVYDMSDWRVYSGSTSTGGTGPSNDHTTGTGDGKYLYIEPSVLCFYKESIIMLPCVETLGWSTPTLSLWYHAWGSDIGRFHVDIFAGSELVTDVIDPIVGNHGNEWKYLEIDLSAYISQKIGIRFRGITGGGQGGDFAIDDVMLSDITSVDGQSKPDGELSLYPNPSTGIFSLKSRLPEAGDYTIKVSDIFGRLIFEKSSTSIDVLVNEVIDLSNYPGGVYIIELITAQGTLQNKLNLK
jgi:hypothetical protein